MGTCTIIKIQVTNLRSGQTTNERFSKQRKYFKPHRNTFLKNEGETECKIEDKLLKGYHNIRIEQ